MLSDKAIVLCVLKVFQKYSDAEHPLSVSDIKKKLQDDFALTVADRRTIYRAIDILNDSYFDYEISKYDQNTQGYYLIRNPEKDLEPSEIQIISDAVCAFPFISARSSENICSKLQEQLNVHEQKQIKNLSIFKSEIKTPNANVFLNIELLDEAISKKIKVKFDYYKYGTDKKLHKRREEKYIVNPYGMVYCNEHYYLACIFNHSGILSLYRIDLIMNLELTELNLDQVERNFSYKDAVKKAIYGFVGDTVNVTMLVLRSEIGHVIDKFGTEIQVSDFDSYRCKVRLKASKTGFEFWALQFLGSVEVLEPQEVRQDIIEIIRCNKYGI